MIYRIEKFDKKNHYWIILFSSPDIDTAFTMAISCLTNNPDVWIRLTTVSETAYFTEEK